MAENFTLLLLSQHYPNPEQVQIFSFEDVTIDADVAGFLQYSEQQVSEKTLDRIYVYAASCAATKINEAV